ncbi:fluoride efflux transporter CrcB [Thalassotalea euphylliae]|uniref:Fluoride-specific ion channel FluC n=1 Tax=Thalassotalea euphylliae TaxID=1655234 RepID=A0A3E0UEQ9_9GAMM|nr:fluoride efflux transporter CrcB [Thalassotalea euphylliae]REL29483.1 fluoride efflux transporter CrcB [Thalassotalea euphylliae]REL35511.1 fluoride efflux transporter CrcB [Thalassotalea euphylliae]
MSNALNSVSMYLLVALGGACGASLRFFISQLVLNWLGKGFPFATLIVNISGSFIMGLLYGLIEQGVIEVAITRTLIGIGFLGALTTFSTFSLDTVLLIQHGEYFKAVTNILLNVVLCVGAAALGIFLVTHR